MGRAMSRASRSSMSAAARRSGCTPPNRAAISAECENSRNRVGCRGMAEADFRPGEAAYLWLMDSLEQIAEGILADRTRAFADIPRSPGHV